MSNKFPFSKGCYLQINSNLSRDPKYFITIHEPDFVSTYLANNRNSALYDTYEQALRAIHQLLRTKQRCYIRWITLAKSSIKKVEEQLNRKGSNE